MLSRIVRIWRQLDLLSGVAHLYSGTKIVWNIAKLTNLEAIKIMYTPLHVVCFHVALLTSDVNILITPSSWSV